MLQNQESNNLILAIDRSLKACLFFAMICLFMPINESNASTPNDFEIVLNNGDNIVEISPEFPGGEAAMMDFIFENINYPKAAKVADGEGYCMVSFTIEKDGSLSNVQIAEKLEGNFGEEVKRVMGLMPKWTPGERNGKKVRKNFNLPIRFKIG